MLGVGEILCEVLAHSLFGQLQKPSSSGLTSTPNGIGASLCPSEPADSPGVGRGGKLIKSGVNSSTFSPQGTTTAHTFSPKVSSGNPMTARSLTAEWASKRFSIFTE
jgi:hypothetical protein